MLVHQQKALAGPSFVFNSFLQAKALLKKGIVLAIVMSFMVSAIPASAHADSAVQVWWPSAGAHLTGSQPFKAMVTGKSVDQYTMYWSVDGGQLVPMGSNYQDYPHKEGLVDLSGWNWNAGGNYTLTFVAKDQNGTVISSQNIPIIIDSPKSTSSVVQTPSPVSQPVQSQPASQNATAQAAVASSAKSISVVAYAAAAGSPITAPTSPVAQVSALPVSSSILNGIKFYVNPYSAAATQAQQWRSSRPADASAMDVLASQSTGIWFGNWNSNIWNDVHAVIQNAQSQGGVPVLVAYDIPDRDCGGYSAGGSNSINGYYAWMGAFASAIGSSKAVVILEPDALANMSCLSESDKATRMKLLSDAVNMLKSNGNTYVYLDAGHAGWVDPAVMAPLLQAANISRADGFSLNVSNFQSTLDTIAYGTQLSQKLNGKHFVIDTSRNGNGSDLSNAWCNPSGRAIGNKPTSNTGNALTDAFLWIKTPGESDGNCNGGPGAGQWWGDYALSLVRNAH